VIVLTMLICDVM